MKRLLVYCFFDKDGIVEDFVFYFLNKMKVFCNDTIIVVNGLLKEEFKEQFLKISNNNLIIRENKGFDSAAFKDTVCKYGFDYFKKYDEVVFANSTFYGPVFDLSEMFEKMEKNKSLDFWGVTKHPEINSTVANVKLTEHIQSYFIAFRNSILSSDSFREYWENLKEPSNHSEAVAYYEIYTTKFYSEKGYKYASYIENVKNQEKIPKIYTYWTTEQIKKQRLPFVKRKIFYTENGYFRFDIKDGVMNLLNIIKNETDYNLDLIYKDIKRNYFQNISTSDFNKKYRILTLKQFLLPWHFEHYRDKKINMKDSVKVIKILKNF